jgi:hypothetical protein
MRRICGQVAKGHLPLARVMEMKEWLSALISALQSQQWQQMQMAWGLLGGSAYARTIESSDR